MNVSTPTRAAFLLAALLAPAACVSRPAAKPYARAFPQGVIQSSTVDVQVFRRLKTLDFTNTTANPLGPGTVWLNHRYCAPFAAIAPGQSVSLPLADFRDEFNDDFKTGGFFSIYAPERLALAQIETTDTAGKPVLTGLVVVGGLPDE